MISPVGKASILPKEKERRHRAHAQYLGAWFFERLADLGAGEDCFRGLLLLEVSLALVGVASPA
jgi:hypothetical protein